MYIDVSYMHDIYIHAMYVCRHAYMYSYVHINESGNISRFVADPSASNFLGAPRLEHLGAERVATIHRLPIFQARFLQKSPI